MSANAVMTRSNPGDVVWVGAAAVPVATGADAVFGIAVVVRVGGIEVLTTVTGGVVVADVVVTAGTVVLWGGVFVVGTFALISGFCS